jgi:hypothetical protein
VAPERCDRTPTRFVPFATFAGSPSRINSGSVISEPLPANVFTKPATKPITGTAASSRTFESMRQPSTRAGGASL